MRSRASRRNPIAGGVGPHAQTPRTHVLRLPHSRSHQDGTELCSRQAYGSSGWRWAWPKGGGLIRATSPGSSTTCSPPSPSSASRVRTRPSLSKGRCPAPKRGSKSRTTACAVRRAGSSAQSPFYARRFASAQVDPAKLDVARLRTIPVTLKQDLIERPEDFRCTDVPAYLATRTTGTTGRPAEVWLSRYEMELWPALGALASVLRGELLPGDIMQVNISSRATAATHLAATSCRLVGAGWRPLGIVPPEASLEGLAEGGATILFTVPSYLAELVTAARCRWHGAPATSGSAVSWWAVRCCPRAWRGRPPGRSASRWSRTPTA